MPREATVVKALSEEDNVSYGVVDSQDDLFLFNYCSQGEKLMTYHGWKDSLKYSLYSIWCQSCYRKTRIVSYRVSLVLRGEATTSSSVRKRLS